MQTIESNKIIKESCGKLEEFLNNDLLKKFSRMHNIKDEYSLFNLKQEIIASRGYFLEVKKRYALHITNIKGVETDEIEIKGISVRRSDYPEITKERISDLLDLLLKEEKLKKDMIKDFIYETRKEIFQLIKDGRKEIAIPVTFSKSLDEYLAIPTGVLGMILWNDLEYSYFVPGTRGFKFKIKDIDLEIAPEKVKKNYHKFGEKNNNIVLPFEESSLPKYYITDLEAMINFCWDDRVKELLHPIWSFIDEDKFVESNSRIQW